MGHNCTVFWMTWYNLDEKLHRKSIESVLNQSNPNLKLVIRDNGSTDGSNALIKEYAAKDKRIIYYRNEVGYQLSREESLEQQSIYKQIFEDANIKYAVMIDHDDFYAPDFLEKAIKKQKESNADMVCVGTSFYDYLEQTITGNRYVKDDIEINKNVIKNGNFIDIYSAIRTNWGKLYTIDTYRKVMDISKNQPKHISGPSDTYVNMNLYSQLNKIAFISESLHYYVSVGNSFYKKMQTDDNIRTFKVLYDLGVELAQYYNSYNEETDVFLRNIYIYSLNDIVTNLLKREDVTFEDKVSKMSFLFDQDMFSGIMLNDMKNMVPWFMYIVENYHIIGKNKDFSILNITSSEYKEVKDNYINFADQELYNEANYYLNILLLCNPFEKDFIYYKIYLCYILKLKEEYNIFAWYYLKMFGADNEVLELTNTIDKNWENI